MTARLLDALRGAVDLMSAMRAVASDRINISEDSRWLSALAALNDYEKTGGLDVAPRKVGPIDHAGGIRGFHFLPTAWCAKVLGLDKAGAREVIIGIYHPEGGTSGEFAIREHRLGGGVTLRLEAYSDAWSALQCFPDVLALLAAHDSMAFAGGWGLAKFPPEAR